MTTARRRRPRVPKGRELKKATPDTNMSLTDRLRATVAHFDNPMVEEALLTILGESEAEAELMTDLLLEAQDELRECRCGAVDPEHEQLEGHTENG